MVSVVPCSTILPRASRTFVSIRSSASASCTLFSQLRACGGSSCVVLHVAASVRVESLSQHYAQSKKASNGCNSSYRRSVNFLGCAKFDSDRVPWNECSYEPVSQIKPLQIQRAYLTQVGVRHFNWLPSQIWVRSTTFLRTRECGQKIPPRKLQNCCSDDVESIHHRWKANKWPWDRGRRSCCMIISKWP